MIARHQYEHEAINAREYPGTRQLCALCDAPTGRCEEDSIFLDDEGPVCEECYATRTPVPESPPCPAGCVQGYIQETGFDPCPECNPVPESGDAEAALHEAAMLETFGPHGQG